MLEYAKKYVHTQKKLHKPLVNFLKEGFHPDSEIMVKGFEHFSMKAGQSTRRHFF